MLFFLPWGIGIAGDSIIAFFFGLSLIFNGGMYWYKSLESMGMWDGLT